MKLTIIIPYFNTREYTDNLVSALLPQINDDVEVFIIDDGSREEYCEPFDGFHFHVIRKKNGGVSSARNEGLDRASGDYIAFIDSDDLVSSDYIERIMAAIKEEPDAVYLSWRTFGNGWEFSCDLSKTDFPAWNLCVWNRVWKRSAIGNVRFNNKKAIAEDAQFIHDVKVKKIVKIEKFVYFYNTENPDSLTKRFIHGEIDFERTIFHYPQITANMGEILTQVKEANKKGEAIVMTEKNELPELANYAMILKPQPIYGTKLVGEPFAKFKQIQKPIKTQVVVYIAKTLKIGGVETWIYNFVSWMSEFYDIIVCYSEEMSGEQIIRLSEKVQVVKLLNRSIACDTVLNMRITDKIPERIRAKQIIQVCHTCKIKEWKIQPNYDRLIYVSDTARQTFEEKGDVIHNLTLPEEKKALLLVTASRFTFEKGAERMLKFAEVLKRAEIPFVWLIFTDREIKLTDGMVKLPPTLNVQAFIQKADYLVQLSDAEAFCYSITEALEAGTPVITTPLTVLKELNFKEGKDGYIIPFDVSGIDARKFLNVPTPEWAWDNEKIVKQWRKILGNTKPKGEYKKQGAFVKVQIIEDYGDLELGRNVKAGEEIVMRRDRARTIIMAGKAVECG